MANGTTVRDGHCIMTVMHVGGLVMHAEIDGHTGKIHTGSIDLGDIEHVVENYKQLLSKVASSYCRSDAMRFDIELHHHRASSAD
jgi:hypothetical protein